MLTPGYENWLLGCGMSFCLSVGEEQEVEQSKTNLAP